MRIHERRRSLGKWDRHRASMSRSQSHFPGRHSGARSPFEKAPHSAHMRRPRLEVLEPRCVLSSIWAMGVEAIPTATDNDYVTNEDTNLVANMIRDDAGHGADTGSQPLIAVAINGQQFEPSEPVQLPSGATVTAQPDGSFTYDPTTSSALSSLPAGQSATDSFQYTVAVGYSNIYTFGDSLSDVGTMYELTGGLVPPSPYWEGHASNGPIWVEDVAEHLGLAATRNNDYAVFGAMTGHDNYNDAMLGGDFPGLLDEVDRFVQDVRFVHRRGRCPGAVRCLGRSQRLLRDAEPQRRPRGDRDGDGQPRHGHRYAVCDGREAVPGAQHGESGPDALWAKLGHERRVDAAEPVLQRRSDPNARLPGLQSGDRDCAFRHVHGV